MVPSTGTLPDEPFQQHLLRAACQVYPDSQDHPSSARALCAVPTHRLVGTLRSPLRPGQLLAILVLSGSCLSASA